MVKVKKKYTLIHSDMTQIKLGYLIVSFFNDNQPRIVIKIEMIEDRIESKW